MEDQLLFENRAVFRDWLAANGQTSGGVWLLFGKKGGPKSLSAGEALEEALCFGWIDGQMQKLDETQYKKYFAPRTPKSRWSAINKKLALQLIEQGRMSKAGEQAIEAAKKNGMWDAATGRPVISAEQVEGLKALLEPHEQAYRNFLGMSPSVQRNYAGLYLEAKSEATRAKRLKKIVDRLEQNLKPM